MNTILQASLNDIQNQKTTEKMMLAQKQQQQHGVGQNQNGKQYSIMTTLHGYKMTGPFTPGGKDVWYCDHKQCTYTQHGVYRRYKIQNWRSSQFGKKFVLCDGCVRQHQKVQPQQIVSQPSNVNIKVNFTGLQQPQQPQYQQQYVQQPQYAQQVQYGQQPMQYAQQQPQQMQYVQQPQQMQYGLAQPQQIGVNGMVQPQQIQYVQPGQGQQQQQIISQPSMQIASQPSQQIVSQPSNVQYQVYQPQQEAYQQQAVQAPKASGRGASFGQKSIVTVPSVNSMDQSGGVASVRKGYMMKKGDLIKSWKKRYFVLKTNKTLVYYENDKTTMIKGTCWLTKVHSVKTKSTQSFEVLTTKRKWCFACKDKNDRDDWVQKIKQVIDM